MGLMKKLTSAVVASSLVLGLVGTALAAPTADEQQASYARMEALKLVQGTDRGPELDGPLTRAQLLTIIVRAFQDERAAKASMAVGSFSDVPGGQWYSGYVAVAKTRAEERGFAIGYPDGTFKPNNQVTVIEALAMIMKFLGVPVGAGDNWIAQTIENAKAYGVITDADVEKFLSDPNAAATRGVAIALADQIFSTYKVAGTDKTVYTYYVDTQAPVISVDPIGTPTVDVAEITLKGKIEGADKAFVTPQGGEQMEITLGADGTFSVVVPLVAGENNIVISATDIAGNYNEQVVRVNRVAGAAAEIQVASTEITVPAGSEFELGYKVVDATGLELAEATAAVKVTVEGEIGTVDGGVLTASEKVGTGTITLSYEGLEDVVINVKIVPAELAGVKIETESAAPGEAVKLIAVDAYGNAITEGVTFSTEEKDAFIKDDIFTATEPGVYKVTATQGEKSVTSDIKVYGEVDELVIKVPAQMVRNGTTEYTVTVMAVDKNGALVRNFDGPVTLEGNFIPAGDMNVDAENGVAEFKIKVVDAEVYLVATAEVDGDIVDEEIEVETVKPVASGLKLETSPKTSYYGLGPRAIHPTITVKVVDQAGAGIAYKDDVVVRVSGPAEIKDEGRRWTISGLTATGQKFEIEHDDWETEGDITITATAGDFEPASLTLKAIQVGQPRNLVITKLDTGLGDKPGYAYYRIGLTDSNGVPVKPSDNYEVTLTFSHDDIGGIWWTTGHSAVNSANEDDYGAWALPLGDDNETVVHFVAEKDPKDTPAYIFVLIKAKEGKAVSFDAKSPRMTRASVDVEFKAGPAAKIAVDPKTVTLRDGESKTIELQVTDAQGAPVKEVRTLTLEDQKSVLRMNGRRGTVTVKTDASGKAKVTVSPDLLKDETSITVTGHDLTPATIKVYRATNDVWRIDAKVGYFDSDNEFQEFKDTKAIPRQDLVIKLVPVDRYGKVIEANLTQTEGSNLGPLGTISEGGKIVAYFAMVNARDLEDDTEYTFAWVDYESARQPEGRVTFKVIAPAEPKFLEINGPSTLTTGTAGTFQVKVLDQRGNAFAVNGTASITVKALDLAGAPIVGTGTIPSGQSEGTVNVTIPKGNSSGKYALRFVVTVGTVPLSTVMDVDVVAAPEASKLQLSDLPDTVVDGGTFEVTVTVLDQYGNAYELDTDEAVTVELEAEDGSPVTGLSVDPDTFAAGKSQETFTITLPTELAEGDYTLKITVAGITGTGTIGVTAAP